MKTKNNIEKETQDTFWYPPLKDHLHQDELWRKKEIGFYIHIPFCKSVCKYCPFNKYAWNPAKIDAYLDALYKEIEMLGKKHYFKDCTFTAGYLGGGTPTALSTEQLSGLISHYKRHFDIDPHAEISVEANPETVDQEKLSVLLESGVNRVSFGIQSFDDHFLRMIGRFHKTGQAITAIELARKTGYKNVNIDLLYYLPGQTTADVEKDLRKAIDLKPEHITAYPLILSEGTRLLEESVAGKIPSRGGGETEDDMFRLVSGMLVEAGYGQYIIWDFAIPGSECSHHRLCLEPPHREYIGIGAGAYSHIAGCTYLNAHGLEEYTGAIKDNRFPISYGKRLTVEDEMHRHMVLGVYFSAVNKKKFKERFGVEIDTVFAESISRLAGLGWIENKAESLTLTEEGKRYIANVSNAFYSGKDRGSPHSIPAVLQKEKN